MRLTVMPLLSRGTTIIDCCLYLSGFLGSVLPMKMRTWQRLSPMPDVHHLWPLITYSLPWRTIEDSILVASEDATLGSVIANADRIFPSSSGSSHCFLCSGVP